MSNINMSSIIGKADKYIQSNAGRKRVNGTTIGTVSGKGSEQNAEEAAKKFIDVLRQEIGDNTMLSTNVKAALDSVSYRMPRKTANGQYEIEIYFTNDMSRPSLRPSSIYKDHTYEPIDSLAKLYNNGVDHTMNRIWGTWGDKEGVGSRTDIPTSNFMLSAKNKFESNYSVKFGVTKIEIDSGYNMT